MLKIIFMRYIGEYEKLTTEFHKRGNTFHDDLHYPARSVVPYNADITVMP
jgi:hypothetical protein